MGKRSKASRHQNKNEKKAQPEKVTSTLLEAKDPFASGEAVIRGREDSLAAVAAESREETLFFESEPTPLACEVAPSREELEEQRRSHIHLAQARVRRAAFSRYVSVAVAVSLGVCVAGGFRHYLSSSRPAGTTFGLEARAEGAQETARPLAPAPQAPAAQPAPQKDLAQAAVPNVETPAAPVETAQPLINPPAVIAPPAEKPVVPPQVDTATAPTKVAANTGNSTEDRKAAQKALDRGNVKGAIAAGERAVEADATDGDAWLVLGAAYQMAGRNADARRAFSSCVKQGKRGAIGECRAMLR